MTDRTASTATPTTREPALSRVGKEWSELRIQKGLSVRELARRSGISASVVGFIDQGRWTPTPDQAQALLSVLRPPEGPPA